MKLLADENFPGPTIRAIRAAGFNITEPEETGAADAEVLQRAKTQGRILLTLDKDFGELAVRDGRPTVGVILFRLRSRSPDEFTSEVLRVLRSREDWAGNFSVVTKDRIRMRRV